MGFVNPCWFVCIFFSFLFLGEELEMDEWLDGWVCLSLVQIIDVLELKLEVAGTYGEGRGGSVQSVKLGAKGQ